MMTPHTSPVPVPSEQLQREIAQLKLQIQSQVTDVNDVAPLELRVQQLTTQAALNPEKYRGDLHDAVTALNAAVSRAAERAQQNKHLDELTKALSEQQAVERTERANAASRRVSQAIEEYRAACLIAAKAHRNVLNTVARNQHIPGAQTRLPQNFAKFHIPHLLPVSWSGSLGESMAAGLMPWESNREEAA